MLRSNFLLIAALFLLVPNPLDATTRPPTPDTGSSLPDLVVESTRITIPGFTGGCRDGGSTNLQLEICIANDGTGAGAFNLTANGRHFARVSGIDADETVCVYGTHTYPNDTTIFLDDENEIEESDEDNNITTHVVPIPTPPPTCSPTPTATVTPSLSCPGDCDGNGSVLVNELVLMINIGLDRASVDACPHYEEWLCRPVCINLINLMVEAVNRALRGCEGPQ